jgi:alkylation response protein AidB-like acyl-CoA dehydrogenase
MAILNEEQVMLRDAAKDWTQEKSPVSALRKLREAKSEIGFDRALWQDMAQMGWAGVIIPESHGGADFGYRSLGLVLEETGRTLTASPLVSTALTAASALILGGSPAQQAAWLPKIAAGEIVASLAVDETAHHAPNKIGLTATQSGDGYVLNGKKTFVLEGLAADLLIVAARTSGAHADEAGITLFLVEASAEGVSRQGLHMIDHRGVANISFDKVTVSSDAVLGTVDGGFGVLEATLDRARIGLAAEMMGTATQAFEITLDYLKTRTQFGQGIGTFQALQHRAAKLYTDLELARSCVQAALDALDDKINDVRALASLAKAKAGDVLHLATNEMVQMHGGIGMTDAHDAGLYMKRARVAEASLGGSSYHRDRYAKLGGF